MSDPEPTLVEFDYRPSKRTTLLLFALVAAGAVALCCLAITADQGIVFFGGLWRINARQVRWFFTFMAALSPIGLLGLGMSVRQAFKRGRRVAISRDAVLVPRMYWRFSEKEIRIPLTAITSVAVGPFVGNARVLRITYEGGVDMVFDNSFRNKKDFDMFAEIVRAAVDDLHGGGPHRDA